MQAYIIRHLLKRQYGKYANRSFVTRSAYKDEGTKKVIQDIRKLEQKLDTAKKMEKLPFGKLDEHDIQAIYKDLAQPVQQQQQHKQPKVSADYLEKLRVKFLDTRPLQRQLASSSPGLLSENNETASTDQQDTLTTTSHQSDNATLDKVSVYDFEQLIYVNALAKRPEQAEQVLQLMKDADHIPTVRCYNHLMDAYANVENVEQVIAVFKRLSEANLAPDVYSYSSLIKVLVQSSRLNDAFVIFEQMKKSTVLPSQPVFANLISGCLKSNQVEQAWKTFDEMRLSFYQPDEVTFTLMLHACAKNGEVERALNLFEEMSGLQLYPTDVTFNVLIHACAKRPDYYDEAFSLLHQMEELHGFQPDLITYNTLIGACARKKDLSSARDILRHILEHDQMEPDNHTFTNLFWCYANYDPSTSSTRTSSSLVSSPPTLSSSSSSSSTTLVPHTIDHLLPHQLPARRSEVVHEAEKLFTYLQQQHSIPITTSLLTAYLNTHVTQLQTKDCASMFDTLFSAHNLTPVASTFRVMLRHCYQAKDATLAWRIWDDYQRFLESRALPSDLDQMSMIEQKKVKVQRHKQQVEEGWTLEQQRGMIILMASVLARANELNYAVQLLSSAFVKGGEMKPLHLKEALTVYNKAIQLEDQQAVQQITQLCSHARRNSIPKSSKYRRVNLM